MANKLALTFTLVCFFFAFSHAVNDVVEELKETPFPESDPKDSTTTTANIFLPTQKPESDPVNTIEFEPESLVESEHVEKEEEVPKDSEPVNSVPLTVISFRPINDRHFPRRPFPLTFPHGHRCRHQHLRLRLRRSAWGPRSYGDDMILSRQDQSSNPVFGGVRQIPARWVKFGHMDEIDSPHHHHHYHHGHHRHHHDDEAEHEGREHEHKHDHGFGSGLLKSFRKFLNHF
ncbi:hypothetical protein PanWU01x14_260640 [Parasponia andersonii]|uniref:Uncharacterized protein n=1 Tax=Parasponia andersonii TaxID=3476 RepID=A0A2P5B8X5_PARAD|nr:hypothetical protein PanWU01x14_260640 [Parasponia andersonii]